MGSKHIDDETRTRFPNKASSPEEKCAFELWTPLWEKERSENRYTQRTLGPGAWNSAFPRMLPWYPGLPTFSLHKQFCPFHATAGSTKVWPPARLTPNKGRSARPRVNPMSCSFPRPQSPSVPQRWVIWSMSGGRMGGGAKGDLPSKGRKMFWRWQCIYNVHDITEYQSRLITTEFLGDLERLHSCGWVARCAKVAG